MTRVLIVDDHPLFRDGLAGLLATLPEMEVTGTAGTAEEALEALSCAAPDVVLMDINLPGASGVEATRRGSRRSPRERADTYSRGHPPPRSPRRSGPWPRAAQSSEPGSPAGSWARPPPGDRARRSQRTPMT